MAKNGPNKTVARARRAMGGFPPREPRPDPFMDWLAEQVRSGVTFATLQEAQEAYQRADSKGRTADTCDATHL